MKGYDEIDILRFVEIAQVKTRFLKTSCDLPMSRGYPCLQTSTNLISSTLLPPSASEWDLKCTMKAFIADVPQAVNGHLRSALTGVTKEA